MNDEYISRTELVEALLEIFKVAKMPRDVAEAIASSIPSADVVEVRHGKWSHDYIKDGMEYNDWFNLHCSVCGETQRDAWGKWNYCPNCGAKMDGKEQEHE